MLIRRNLFLVKDLTKTMHKNYSVFSMLATWAGKPDEHKTKEQEFRSIGKMHPKSYADFDDLPPIEVTGKTAVCDGGLNGHPVEYVKVEYSEPNFCKYCSQRFIRIKGGSSH